MVYQKYKRKDQQDNYHIPYHLLDDCNLKNKNK